MKLKKVLSILLVAVMLISVIPFTANAADVSFTKVTSAGDITTDNIGTCTAEDAKAWALANWDVAHDYDHDTHLAFYSNTGELNVVLVDYGMNEHSFSRNFDYCIYTSYSIFHLKTWYADGDAIFFCTAAAPAPGEPAEGAAEDGPLVGTVIKIGDTLTLDGDYFEFAPGLKTSTTADFELYQMSYNEDFNAWLFTFTPNDVVFLVEGDETPKPDGFYVSGGNGTESHPYTFALHYGPAPTTYTIIWKSDVNTVIDTTQVEEGATPTHAAPADYEDADYTYTFAGWTPEVVAATADATYTANFTATPKPHNNVNLTLGEDITSNYYVDYNAYAGAAKIVYTYNSVNEREENVPVEETVDLTDIPAGLLDGDKLMLTVSQAPAQMAETTHIRILDANEQEIATLDYSAKSYCDKVLGMTVEQLAALPDVGTTEKAEKLQTLCNTIIAYGYAAQGVFADYETTAITTKDFSTAVKNQIDAAYCYAEHSVNNSGAVKFKSASFACTKDARLRFYLDTAAATGTPAAPVEKNGYSTAIKYVLNEGVKVYYIEVSGIDAVDFDKKMEVSYGGSSISCSVLDFCGLAFTYGDTPVQDLARTLIVYNQNAEAYFG